MAKPSLRCIVSLRYTPATGPSSTRRAVGDFLRYVQYRDHHERESRVDEVGGLLRYVAWRDAATPQGRLFTRDGNAGDKERKRLGAFIARSVAGLPLPEEGRPPHRACYRLVISPEDATGLDLRAVARAGLDQLERDAGAGSVPGSRPSTATRRIPMSTLFSPPAARPSPVASGPCSSVGGGSSG